MDDADSKYYLPDDYVFHGVHPMEDYLVESYFAESQYSLFGKVRLLFCKASLGPACQWRKSGASCSPSHLWAPVLLLPGSSRCSSMSAL